MIRKLSENIAFYFVKNKVVDIDEQDLCRYGVEVLLCDIVDVIIVITIAFVFGKIFQALWYYVNFLILRSVTDGYHAKTFISCKVIMAVMMIMVLLFASMVTMKFLYIIVSAFVMIVLGGNIKFKWNKVIFILGYIIMECILMWYQGKLAVLTMEACIIVFIASNIREEWL